MRPLQGRNELGDGHPVALPPAIESHAFSVQRGSSPDEGGRGSSPTRGVAEPGAVATGSRSSMVPLDPVATALGSDTEGIDDLSSGVAIGYSIAHFQRATGCVSTESGSDRIRRDMRDDRQEFLPIRPNTFTFQHFLRTCRAGTRTFRIGLCRYQGRTREDPRGTWAF